MKQGQVKLSVVVPTFNEEQRLSNLDQIISFLKKLDYKSELIVVNDGSTDQTLKILKKLQKKNKFEIISYSQNMGKGFAIAKGMLAAKGERQIFMDVDLSVPLETIHKVMNYKHKSDLIIGTRKTKSAQVVARQPMIRELFGMTFTFLSQLWLGVGVSDFTCGFKVFSKKSSQKIFSKLKLNRWGFDAEVLYLAQKFNFSVQEVPVIWKNDRRTKVRFFHDTVFSLWELWLVRYYDWSGFYG